MNIKNNFNQIYNTYALKVFRLCLGYASGDESQAKDWQQETFIKIWNHGNSFQANSSLSTWIYRITVNTCLNDLRKPKKNIPINERVLETKVNEFENDKKEGQIKKMYECINKLTPNNKAIILLELEDIPQSTIAEMQGITYGAIRTRLNRIRNSLLKCIANEK